MTTVTAVSAAPLEYVKTIGITTNQSGRGFINPYDCAFTWSSTTPTPPAPP
ncbi:MAG: hypothetical protein J4G13_05555 [Dehalococcoidia bacterium]|nr:hypothetical protein [Dehalococcoidia bacterium]